MNTVNSKLKKTVRILVVDDHRIFIDGISSLLSEVKNITVAGFALSGQAAVDFVKENQVDLILMDISMPPGITGIEATRIIKKYQPGIKVLMLSMWKTKDFIEQVLQCGADGYLLKHTDRAELISAIEDSMAGLRFFSSEVTDSFLKSFDKPEPDSDVKVVLSPRERDVIRLLAKEFTSQEIAEELNLSWHTVETHRKNLLHKLKVRNVVGLALYALQNGLVEEE